MSGKYEINIISVFKSSTLESAKEIEWIEIEWTDIQFQVKRLNLVLIVLPVVTNKSCPFDVMLFKKVLFKIKQKK